MSARFKKGDVVRLVCHDIREAENSRVGFNSYMQRMLGEVCVIKKARETFHGWVYYVEGSQWMWREDWLEHVKGRVDDYE